VLVLIIQLSIWLTLLPQEVPPRHLTIYEQLLSGVMVEHEIFTTSK
jgi:hypothetical protein